MAKFLLHLAVTAVACASLAYSSPPHVVSMTPVELAQAKPVNVTVYYESLCPGCVQFVVDVLSPLWPKVKDVNLMTVNLLPFGNAEEKKIGFDWKFYCQHGAKECQGNIVQACILSYYPETTKQLEAISCFAGDFFSSTGEDWKKSLQSCNKTVDVKRISTCAEGEEGNELEHEIAVKTGPHDYTPWVMLDGVPNEQALEDLLTEVCKAYKGTAPDICKEEMF